MHELTQVLNRVNQLRAGIFGAAGDILPAQQRIPNVIALWLRLLLTQ